MMATLRRQHGGGRDFLQENKQRVSRMETNGRCLAAINARRVPLWRPVVLHYAEKLRPHYTYGHRRSRQGHEAATTTTTNLRSGLAQTDMRSEVAKHPVAAATPSALELARRRQAEHMKQERLQGGWVDPRRTERPMRRRFSHQECQCPQGHQPAEVPQPVQVPPKQGDPDQADRVSQCPSRVSRRSQRERSNAGKENVEPEAPLSARSSASAVTLKAKRSVSQESQRSNVTVKSNATVASKMTNASKVSSASKATNASKRSHQSRMSRNMEIMPLPESHNHKPEPERKEQQVAAEEYEGYTPLTASQKQAAREDAQYKYGKLMEEYNHLPVSVPTMRVRSRRIAIEKQLDELDYAINMFDQPVDMYYKR